MKNTLPPSRLVVLLAMMPSLALAAAATAPVIYDDLRLTSVCAVAATIGAFVSISIFPPDLPSHVDSEQNMTRRIALKFASCLGCGVLFGPMEVVFLADQFNKQVTTDFVVAVVGITSVFGVYVLHRLAPSAEKFLGWRKGK